MTRLIAIDWDDRQAHLVAGKLRGGVVEVQKALTWVEDENPFINPEATGERLKARLKEAGIAPAAVVACVSRDQMVVKEIRFPAVPDAEEPAVVRFQAIKEMADNADDIVIDYFNRSRPGETERRAAALAVRKKYLEGWQKLCQGAGLKLSALLPRLMGVSAALHKVMGTTVVTPAPVPADGAICVVLAGERQAEVAILKGDQFLLARSLASGPGLAAQVRQNLAVHDGQQPGNPVCAIYVGGKGTGELRERIGEVVGDVPVHTFDPFAGSEAAGLPAGNRGLFAGPMGLLQLRAAREFPVNFVSPRQPLPPSNPNIGRLRLAGLVLVFLVLALFLGGQVLLAGVESEVSDLDDQKKEVEIKLATAKAEGKKLKALDEWDNPPWLDEIYELAAMADLKQFRVISLKATGLPRQGKSKFIAQLEVKGEGLGKDFATRRQAFENAETRLAREGFYSVNKIASRFEDTKFTLVINIERRPPEGFKYQIEDPSVRKEKAKGGEKAKTKSKSRR